MTMAMTLHANITRYKISTIVTPLRSPRIGGLKSQILKPPFFKLNMMVKSGLVFFYFEILLAPSELPANLPGQFSLSRQLALHWAAATLKGLVGFQNKKF